VAKYSVIVFEMKLCGRLWSDCLYRGREYWILHMNCTVSFIGLLCVCVCVCVCVCWDSVTFSTILSAAWNTELMDWKLQVKYIWQLLFWSIGLGTYTRNSHLPARHILGCTEHRILVLLNVPLSFHYLSISLYKYVKTLSYVHKTSIWVGNW
jgi:hypothetical protein